MRTLEEGCHGDKSSAEDRRKPPCILKNKLVMKLLDPTNSQHKVRYEHERRVQKLHYFNIDFMHETAFLQYKRKSVLS
ncbi:hypothetical protein KIN20_022155 [Parelaphostrongylus tenuis]|uniref:Uncharacterized protein n=1 Tax=Parelaphostrongylus tenuis TaxID=148309 RepID=A0AAD5QV10_PARTN|nr:hypothetical protein KIN20_022155 [Parelaphostrongylus tenuis]